MWSLLYDCNKVWVFHFSHLDLLILVIMRELQKSRPSWAALQVTIFSSLEASRHSLDVFWVGELDLDGRHFISFRRCWRGISLAKDGGGKAKTPSRALPILRTMAVHESVHSHSHLPCCLLISIFPSFSIHGVLLIHPLSIKASMNNVYTNKLSFLLENRILK